MDKLSVDGSKVHGPGRQLAYRLPLYDPSEFQVKVCALRGEDPGAAFLRENEIDTVCLGRSKFDLRAIIDLLAVISEWKPDILHLHGYASWPIGRIAGRLKGCRIVVQEHFVQETVPAYQRFADWCLRDWHDAAIAVSEVVADFMRDGRYIRDATTPVEVIWNGVPVDEFRMRCAMENSDIHTRLGLPESARLIGIVGRLAEEKGHRYFLEAAAEILRSRNDCWFVVVGEGPLRGALEEMSADLGITPHVRFVGHQADIVPFFRACDVAVIASLSEGFPSVGIEALACGAPLVVSDLETFRAFYRDAHNVLVVPPCDGPALAAAVQRILDEPGLSESLLAGADELLETCRITSVAARYTALYDRLSRSAGI
jgi:glycosyltransferase involved in cell wall biosynthesis